MAAPRGCRCDCLDAGRGRRCGDPEPVAHGRFQGHRKGRPSSTPARSPRPAPGSATSASPTPSRRSTGRPGSGARLQGGLEIEWVNPVKVDMTYTDSLVRQGETLDMKDVVGTQTGKVKVSAFVSGFIGIYQRDPDQAGVPWLLNESLLNANKTIEIGTFDCTIPLPGESPRRCDIGEKEQTIFTLSFYEVISLDVNIKGELFFDADGTPITTLRILTTSGGNTGGLQKDLSFAPTSPVTLDDPMQVPCTEPAGNDARQADGESLHGLDEVHGEGQHRAGSRGGRLRPRELHALQPRVRQRGLRRPHPPARADRARHLGKPRAASAGQPAARGRDAGRTRRERGQRDPIPRRRDRQLRSAGRAVDVLGRWHRVRHGSENIGLRTTATTPAS